MAKRKDGQTAAATNADEGQSAIEAVLLRPVIPVATGSSPNASMPRSRSKIARLVALLGEAPAPASKTCTAERGNGAVRVCR